MSDLSGDFLAQNPRAEKQVESLIASFSDLEKIENSDSLSSLDEIPMYRADPHAFLPRNAEPLNNTLDGLFKEVNLLLDEELKEVSRHIRKADTAEEKVRKNDALIRKNLSEIKKNTADIVYQEKSRDYWMEREQEVFADYQQIEGSSCETDWAWLIRKYGLKESNGVLIDYRDPRVSEFSKQSASDLMTEYKEAGFRHERSLKGKEVEISLLEQTNQELSQANEELGGVTAHLRLHEIKPLQDGVLLFRELSLKLKALKNQERKATFKDIRSWAESFLDQFLRKHPLIPYRVVSAFRRLASIPLPSQNS